MSIEEVIDFLKSKEKLYSQMDDSDRKDYVLECLDTAIKILSTEKTDEDLISRQAVLDLFGDIHPLDYNNRAYVSMIKELPSVDVKPIVYGEWVYREELFDDEEKPRMVWGCNKCWFNLKSIHDKRNFCPNCGATMRKESEEEKRNGKIR